jgi:hypothetical protein
MELTSLHQIVSIVFLFSLGLSLLLQHYELQVLAGVSAIVLGILILAGA